MSSIRKALESEKAGEIFDDIAKAGKTFAKMLLEDDFFSPERDGDEEAITVETETSPVRDTERPEKPRENKGARDGANYDNSSVLAKYCTECGAACGAQFKFCGACGAKR